MSDGINISIDFTLLPLYTGALSNALIPVQDATTGDKYKIAASQVLVGDDIAILPFTAVGGSVETITALHGKVLLAVFRGTSLAGWVITSGTPNGFQVKWNSATDELTAPASNDWYPTEPLTIMYKI